jgi:two-component system chemotaxis response regulator CheY
VWAYGLERRRTLGKRVLITDDAMFMRVTLKNILTQNGYEVAGEACNGKEAVKLYQELAPDLVTMDITMPEMDGITALKEIKKVDPDAVVVMCTAMGQKNLVVEAIQAGARDFITKPFQPPRVLESLGKLLG